MPDLNELREKVNAARAQGDATARTLAAEKEKLRALRGEDAALARRSNDQNEASLQRRKTLARQIAASEARIREGMAAKTSSRDKLTGIYGQLAPLTDPRRAIGAFDANYPILLFPVRLETRFVKRPAPAATTELLVRIYPDDCLVDTFEPDLSDSEVKNLRRYWCSLWAAGGDEGLQRSAWRELCSAHGAGRALYLTRQYAPLPDSDPIPARASGSEVILAVALDAPIAAAAEKNAIATYWRAIWRAGRDQARITAADNTLRLTVSAARADEIRRTLVPFNIGDRPQAGVDRATVPVSTVFVVLTPAAVAAVKRQGWTRAPQSALLPDRFVLFADSGPEHVEMLGDIIQQPLAVGPDPLADEAEQFSSADGDLSVPEQMKWMTDFAAALKVGMAFRITLTPRQAAQGFDRLYVLGVRLTSDHDKGRAELEDLLRHHANSQSGFGLLPQGTPTNNTEGSSSGWARIQEADDIFDVAQRAQAGEDQFDATATDPYARRDGLVLAEALGIDAAVLQEIPNADGTDQAEARAMNAALWPATLGYWMDTQMSPAFGADTIERTRRHFIDHVSGRGTVPAVRIGKQPYGILPTAAVSRMNGLDPKYLGRMRELLLAVARDYWDGFAANAPWVGKRSDKPQQQLLDIIGLHASSVEFHLNVVDSADQLWNHAGFYVGLRSRLEALMRAQIARGMDLLRSLGYSGTEPEVVSKFFAYVHGPMTRPVIDTPPLSETEELTPCTDDGKNYITWCREKAEGAFDDLRQQIGFSAGKTPDALLYHMLRHALQLGYHNAAVGLHETHGLLTPADLARVYREPAFVHVANQPAANQPSESRYQLLYARPQVITGVPGRTVAEFIPTWLAAGGANSVLADQLTALGVLEHTDTASLERAFAEHIDLCSYRWDAWMLSLVNQRLDQMRRPGHDPAARRLGIYLGAFGWVEPLKPDPAALPAPTLSDEAKIVFERPGDAPLQRDPANGGHVLAPSLNHAVTAAVLRSGYLHNATPSTPSLFAVDLSSSRVRIALQFIEGIRNGQSLGALLGYQFERRLHDRHAEAEVDRFIYQVRKAFPLAAKRITETVEEGAETASIESVEARNVCDGMLLLEHVRNSAVKTYPWGKDLEPANPTEQGIIDQEVTALFEIQDAIADVAIAESVHQVAAGNAERAAAAMDAYSKGGFPPEPDVVTTPRTGLSLTHRVGLHLPVDAVAPGGATPRAQAEPALDAWLSGVLPPLAEIVVRVTAKNATPGAVSSDVDVIMQTLGLRPIDLLHMLDVGSDAAMGELDDRILHHVIATQGLCPDASVIIRYTVPVAGKKTLFEVMPLVTSLRAILLNARPLKPSDATLQNEATPNADEAVTVPPGQVTAAQTSVTKVKTDATALLAILNPLAQPAAAIASIAAGVDAAFGSFMALGAQAGLCGIVLAGAGSILRARRDWFALVRGNAEKVLARWQTKLTACDAQRAIGSDAGNSDLMRVQALVQAEREISTAYTDPIPATPAPLIGIVNGKRATFVAAMSQVDGVRVSAATTLGALWTAWATTFAGRPALDLTVEDTVAEEQQLRLLVTEMQRLVNSLVVEADKRITKATGFTTDAASAGGARKAELLTEAVKALLGEGFRIVPRFVLSADQADEWQNAFDGRAPQLAHLAASHEFPVDDWMYGTARVRTKMHDLENVIQLAGAFGTTEPVLTPTQFPFDSTEPWLAMELPAGFDTARVADHLLYTASYPNGTFDKTATDFGGLLLDEWTEVIPNTRETASLAFNYDRPSHEPPQTMLLVTPATPGDQWNWEDLRAAIPETFELAKKRAVEPRDIAGTPLARVLPATLMAFTTHAISISSQLRPTTVAVAAAAQVVPNG